ncbi:MAG: FAD-binding oxidoreductase [Crocosphaera sp.]|nr:FAD-binding oxidoreductase [Crocosphaera sp.]
MTINKKDQGILQALNEWISIVGIDRVITSEELTIYKADTDVVSRNIPAVVKPSSPDQVSPIVKVANCHKIAIYPISTGKNWGYGSGLPTTEDTVILDLSDLRKIVDFDAELGTVTVQPGVTQQDLRDYLDKNNLPFLVPTTGSSPNCSLMGNALERGYGIAPIADHFEAIMSLKAVLPNGDIYISPLREMGGKLIHKGYKWGFGPYIDGLFSQGAFGIVTEVTLSLSRQPEIVEAFYFWVDDQATLESTLMTIQEIVRTLGDITGSIKLFNSLQFLSVSVPYPMNIPSGETLSNNQIAKLSAGRNISLWMGMGTLYGSRHIVKAARNLIKDLIKPISKRVLFLTKSRVKRLQKIGSLLPGNWAKKQVSALKLVEQALMLVEGRPSEYALSLSYWKSGQRPDSGYLNPANDGCGLIWYAPLVPMKPKDIPRYIKNVEYICRQYGLEPLITLTCHSHRCLTSTVPLLFDPQISREVERAHACYKALVSMGKQEGWIPYRIGINFRQELIDPNQPFWRLVTKLKTAVDPNHIIAPGRYALTKDES